MQAPSCNDIDFLFSKFFQLLLLLKPNCAQLQTLLFDMIKFICLGVICML